MSMIAYLKLLTTLHPLIERSRGGLHEGLYAYQEDEKIRLQGF
jgi:hypothetical protein